MQLKSYQQQCLDTLQLYFQSCLHFQRVSTAFTDVTEQIYGQGLPYHKVKELPDTPYVCLRIPTGGGKTLVAAHAVGLTAPQFMQTAHPVVLWLVPSNAILEQTLIALKNPAHPYRQALEQSFNSLHICTVYEAFSLQPATLATNATLIIATLQAFRVEDKEGRKVYEASGSLLSHFSSLSPELLHGLERYEHGKAVPSLANLLRLHRPLVIVDEAHNARTNLSFETLARFNPSCILEFTATPNHQETPSNVLHTVSAAELHAENMIKMPIRLTTRPDWQELLSDAITTLNYLQGLAELEQQVTREYLRPIMLLQAQPSYKNKPSLTVETVEACLLNDHKIPAAQIARATGKDNDLEGLDLSAPNCPIRFIITVQALREGWDCPFAYVLCSVSEVRSNTAIEQILGRVLRLPQARRKTQADLNVAYAFASATSFVDTANALADSLIQNGFERQEAKEFLQNFNPQSSFTEPLFTYQPSQIRLLETPNLSYLSPDLASKVSYHPPTQTLQIHEPLTESELYTVTQTVPDTASQAAIAEANQKLQPRPTLQANQVILQEIPDLSLLPTDLATKVSYHAPTRTFTLHQSLTSAELQTVNRTVQDLMSQTAIDHANRKLQTRPAMSPAERGEQLRLPQLVIKQGDLFELLEQSHFLEQPWDLTACDARLTEAEFPTERELGRSGEITITSGKLQINPLTQLHQQMRLLEDIHGWDVADLVYWLENNFVHTDIEPNDMDIFLTRVVQLLLDQRHFTLDQLVQDKYRLRDAVMAKVNYHRQKAHQQAYQAMLFSATPTAEVVVSPEYCFTFDPQSHPYNKLYQGEYGRYHFTKHYYAIMGNLGSKEEYDCAVYLDMLPEVKIWVRNFEAKPRHGFWLQTSTDKFYPDFIALLQDGRYLVVEYKGAHLVSNDDSKEKLNLGELWAKRSQGRCLFVMPTEKKFEVIKAMIKQTA